MQAGAHVPTAHANGAVNMSAACMKPSLLPPIPTALQKPKTFAKTTQPLGSSIVLDICKFDKHFLYIFTVINKH